MHSTAVLRGLRYPKITLRSAALVSILNIFFSYLFAIIFDYGIVGIGLASTLSFLSTFIYSSYVQREKLRLLTQSTESVDKKYLKKKFFSVGFQILLRSMFLTGFMTVLRNTNNNIDKLILPIRGYGLWGTLFGYVAIEEDFNTVAGLEFYERALHKRAKKR